jgi:hypothetical protein
VAVAYSLFSSLARAVLEKQGKSRIPYATRAQSECWLIGLGCPIRSQRHHVPTLGRASLMPNARRALLSCVRPRARVLARSGSARGCSLFARTKSGERHEKSQDDRSDIGWSDNPGCSSCFISTVPRQRLVSVPEFCGSEDRTTTDTGKYCRRQQASASAGVSALRVWRDLLLITADRTACGGPDAVPVGIRAWRSLYRRVFLAGMC